MKTIATIALLVFSLNGYAEPTIEECNEKADVDAMLLLSASLAAIGAGSVRGPIVQSPSAAKALATMSGYVIIETNINE